MNRTKLIIIKILFGIIVLFNFSISAFTQKRNTDVYKFPEMIHSDSRAIIRIPDLDGYITLKCDFHTHTIYSDAQVSPAMRVEEAWRDGLDAVAITDHIESSHRKSHDIVNPDLNKPNEMAQKYAQKVGFIAINGSEIARKKPLGHINALFVNDVNKLNIPNEVEAIKEAVKQGAFIMWNHPGWPNDSCTMYDIHKTLIKDKLINGIEVFNTKEYYPKVLTWIKETGLTLMGNSDIHRIIRNVYGGEKMARPMTLVFAKEKSESGIKEALFAGRTLAIFSKMIAGKEDLLKKLVNKCLEIKIIDSKRGLIEVANNSDLEFIIKYDDNWIKLSPNELNRLTLKKNKEVFFDNCLVEENKNLKMQLW